MPLTGGSRPRSSSPLALGIGINTTVFTLVNAALFKPVLIPGGERLVTVVNQNLTRADSRTGVSYPDFREFKAQIRTFKGLEAASNGQAILSEPGNPPERYDMARISSGLFGLRRTPPVLGRGFSPAVDAGSQPKRRTGNAWRMSCNAFSAPPPAPREHEPAA